MSRSYKKHPCIHLSIKGGKRLSARAFRRFKGHASNGRFYRKVYNTYDVVDYIWIATQEDRLNYKRYREIGRYLRHNMGDPDLWKEFKYLSRDRFYFQK